MVARSPTSRLMKTKYISKFCPLLMAAAITAGSASAATISQSAHTYDSGNNSYGQQFMVESAFFPVSQVIDSITFLGSTQTFANYFLNIYSIGTADIATLNFANGTETANLSFLGSSTTAVSYPVASAGTPLTWDYSGITLALDTALFAVFSTTATEGTFNFTRVRGVADDSASFENITLGNSARLGSGTPGGGQQGAYSIELTAIPEPSTALLGGLGMLMLLRRRRA